MTPEGKVKSQIKGLLNRYGVWYFMPVSIGLGVHGIPDFVCCFKGCFFGIEAKAPGKKPTNLQLLQKKKIENAGGLWFLVDGEKSLLEVKKLLDVVQERGY